MRVMSAGRRGSMVLVMSGSPPTARRLRWTASPFADVALALVLGVLSLQSAFGEQGREHLWAFVVLIELAVLPLAVRRARPLAVLAITLAAAIAGDLLFNSFQLPGPVIALYTVAVHCERRLAMTAAAATALALVIPAVGDGGVTDAGFGIAMYAVFGAAWALGDNLRTRRAYLAELEARAERLERDREESARRAVADERARIARELHDVIAHNVSVMVVQAAAGGDVFRSHPERAREALGLDRVERPGGVGRAAPAARRRARRPGGRAGFAPQPGLGAPDELIEQVRRPGCAVELTVAGEPRGLPAGVDLSAYRIVQEALTNTLKHAHASRR